MILGLHHVAVHTRDLDHLRAFYEAAFGFRAVGDEVNLKDLPVAAMVTGVEGAAARVVMLQAGNCFIEMFEWSAPKGRPLQPLRPQDLGYTHFSVAVANIEHEWKRLAELGMTFVTPPVHLGDIGSVYGRDPDGNIIELSEFSEGHPLALESVSRKSLVGATREGLEDTSK